MKKTMFFAALAALLSLASCQKEIAPINGTDEEESPVFTASITGATKTTVNVADGKVAWEMTDEITITDASSASAIYTIKSIDETTGKATFVIKDGILGAGPYTASYGSEPATVQTYSATAGKLYMTAPATSNNNFEFTVQCGLMRLNLTKPGESVKSIAVTSSTNETYTLTCYQAESIASAKNFCIALPDGNYTKIEITNAVNYKCTLNSASGVAVSANHIKPVTLGENKINFYVKFTDDNFKAYCVENFDEDEDGEISYLEASKVKEINISNKNIVTLAGIEYFPALTKLDCSSNDIKSLDLTNNWALTYLDCNGNTNLEMLDGLCYVLDYLDCSGCKLNRLLFPSDSKLGYLDCSNNELYWLLVSDCSALVHLNCSNNYLLISIDLHRSQVRNFKEFIHDEFLEINYLD